MSEEEIFNQRKEKLDKLKKNLIEPYPHKFEKSHGSKEILESYGHLKNEEKTSKSVSVAGRLTRIRVMGKALFADIQDQAGKIQIFIKSDEVGEEQYNIFTRLIDIGDIIGVKGIVFRTKMGELSIWIKNYTLLSKALKPLPEKWHGLQDVEIRYRKRYLDLISNPNVKNVFETRAKLIDELRMFLKRNGFLEVDTPTLQPLYGGAEAYPFVTNLRALNMKLYLRISPEIYLKKLLVGGFERVFTICHNFRNEGIDRLHNPEFTMMEFYASYWDYNDVMKFTEKMVVCMANKIFNTTKINYQGIQIDLGAQFKKYTIKESIKKFIDINVDEVTEAELKKIMLGFKLDIGTKEEMIVTLFDKKVQPQLLQPTFITDYPKDVSPLSKESRGKPDLVERFELFICGMELANAYSELNDPMEQKTRLLNQIKKREKSKTFDPHLETNILDEDFINALEIGMPPAGGFGIGIDRLVMLFTNQLSIRDVVLFPFMKPEENAEPKSK